MINKVVLVGRLSKDAVLRKTTTGVSTTSFTLACDRKVKVDGQPTADFINCVVWKETADAVAKYTSKGSMVGVEGHIQTRSYDDKDGKKIYITEVIAEYVKFLDSKRDTQQTTTSENELPSKTNNYDTDTLDIASDDLPF